MAPSTPSRRTPGKRDRGELGDELPSSFGPPRPRVRDGHPAQIVASAIGQDAHVAGTELGAALQDADDVVKLGTPPKPGRGRMPDPRFELHRHGLTHGPTLDQHEPRAARVLLSSAPHRARGAITGRHPRAHYSLRRAAGSGASVATAWAAMPSSRPKAPIPSRVVALRLTAAPSRRSTPASDACIA